MVTTNDQRKDNLKIQEIKVHVEMLSRKIDEHRPQEAKKVVVDVDAIVEHQSPNVKNLLPH